MVHLFFSFEIEGHRSSWEGGRQFHSQITFWIASNRFLRVTRPVVRNTEYVLQSLASRRNLTDVCVIFMFLIGCSKILSFCNAQN